MKKFFFRLDTLLTVRKMREEKLYREWTFIREKKDLWEAKEAALLSQIERVRKELNGTGEKALIETYAQVLEYLKTSFESIRQTLKTYNQQMEKMEEQLKQAVQERKIIEKIKEKHYSQWRLQNENSEKNEF